jgi:hypothetical protein
MADRRRRPWPPARPRSTSAGRRSAGPLKRSMDQNKGSSPHSVTSSSGISGSTNVGAAAHASRLAASVKSLCRHGSSTVAASDTAPQKQRRLSCCAITDCWATYSPQRLTGVTPPCLYVPPAAAATASSMTPVTLGAGSDTSAGDCTAAASLSAGVAAAAAAASAAIATPAPPSRQTPGPRCIQRWRLYNIVDMSMSTWGPQLRPST